MKTISHLRRIILVTLGLLLLCGIARAQDFPSRPVVLVVPWPAGGTTDVGMRALANATEKYLNQKIVIENRPGAGGVLGPQQVANSAAPDGYTVVQIPITVFRFPFLAYAKANPGKVNYGTPGAGTSLHITMEQIARKLDIKWTHVPFKGTSETTGALLGGHIDAIADATGWGPLVNSGQLRLLVTWNAVRSKNWPNIPTLKETGVDLVSNSPFGIAGPKGMDPKVVKVLHDAFKKGAEDPAYMESMVKLDQEAAYMSSDQYRRYALEQLVEQKKLIEDLGLNKQD